MYNANLSYEENYLNGPFIDCTSEKKFPLIKYLDAPKFEFLGIPLHIPFGVPAGPLLNANYVKVALDAGFCLPTYKTVRSKFWQSHQWPNVLAIEASENFFINYHNINVHARPISTPDYYDKNLSISNSFGVPSKDYCEWQNDFYNLTSYSNIRGLHTVLSFQPSNSAQFSQISDLHEFLSDTQKIYQLAADTVAQTGFMLLELNLSCPNTKQLPIFKDLTASKQVLSSIAQIRQKYPKIKLIVKIGCLNSEEIHIFLSEIAQYIDAISAINTISAKILNFDNEVILGSGSITGGVCGKLILQQGLYMMERLAIEREKLGLKRHELGLIGVGGVSDVTNFTSYINAGADMVQAATGMMWNLNLAQEIADSLMVRYDRVI